MRRVLILGGTGEAVVLARMLHDQMADQVKAISALAGVTQSRAPIPGAVRIGGFGGASGLADYIQAEGIDVVIDATHPFAAQMAAQAHIAADRAGVLRLKIVRPTWRRDPRDRWIEVPDLAAAAATIPRIQARRVFLTVGGRSLQAFQDMPDVWFLARTTDAPLSPSPLANADHIVARGPFQRAAEIALMREHRIDLLVAKASGGAATEAKIEAARAVDIPTVIIRRPEPPPGATVEDAVGALAWLRAELARLMA